MTDIAGKNESNFLDYEKNGKFKNTKDFNSINTTQRTRQFQNQDRTQQFQHQERNYKRTKELGNLNKMIKFDNINIMKGLRFKNLGQKTGKLFSLLPKKSKILPNKTKIYKLLWKSKGYFLFVSVKVAVVMNVISN